MPTGNRKTIAAALHVYQQEELEDMIRQMKIEGGTLDDCVAEMHFGFRQF
jgi:hypothetical protein